MYVVTLICVLRVSQSYERGVLDSSEFQLVCLLRRSSPLFLTIRWLWYGLSWCGWYLLCQNANQRCPGIGTVNRLSPREIVLVSGVPRTALNYHHHRQCWVTASCPGFPDAGLRSKVSLQSYPVIQAALLGYLWWLDGLSWLHGSGLDSKFGLQLPHLVGRRPYPDRLDSDAMPWLPGAGLCETLGRTVSPGD